VFGVGSATVDGPDPAYGVFDTLLVRDGAPVDLEAHVGRLTRSVHALYDVPVDPADLAARIVAGARGLGTARVRTSYDPGGREWQVEVTPIAVQGLDPRTLVRRRHPGGLGAHKWSDRRPVCGPDDADDVLLVDEEGLVLECGSANVFAVLDGAVTTPPLDGRILPGTVRADVLARLRAEGARVSERGFAVAELAWASEVFTTSSIRGVQPVTACLDVASWEMGPTTSWLRQAGTGPK
jgi:para-aminobenzoate synthetase/4-amino-4-deoxychorismate lyase